MIKNRTTLETVIICVAAVAIVGILSGNAPDQSSKSLVVIVLLGVLGLGMTLGFRYLTVKKRTQLELTGDQHYRQLAEEYRRLADMAITAQEHTDLKLGDLSAQLDYLREQNDRMQKILSEVE
jgi:hypothetical protein